MWNEKHEWSMQQNKMNKKGTQTKKNRHHIKSHRKARLAR